MRIPTWTEATVVAASPAYCQYYWAYWALVAYICMDKNVWMRRNEFTVQSCAAQNTVWTGHLWITSWSLVLQIADYPKFSDRLEVLESLGDTLYVLCGPPLSSESYAHELLWKRNRAKHYDNWETKVSKVGFSAENPYTLIKSFDKTYCMTYIWSLTQWKSIVFLQIDCSL